MSRPPRRTTPGDPRGPERGGELEFRQQGHLLPGKADDHISATPGEQPQAEPAEQPPPATPTVPIRPDGWPDWLGRRPMSNSDRDKIRQALTEGLPEGPLTDPGPFLCYLTIDGLHRTDPGNLIALRGRIHAAARTAAEGRATTYHATDSTITIGIRGPDAADRINQLRHALAKLITKHGWTTRDQPR